jgi:hypothetical protein
MHDFRQNGPGSTVETSKLKRRNLFLWLAKVAAVLLACAFLQWTSGAYTGDISGNSDEPAHVVSGLMVRDYIAHFAGPEMTSWPSNPQAFAEAYYVHFPKVAIGHWPPMFYIAQAIWMLAFGRTKIALIIFMLVITAATASLLMYLTRSLAGELTAFVITFAFLLLPITQQSLDSVMPDALLALLSSLVMIAGGRVLQGRRRWWIAFWFLIMIAISVHMRGAALVPSAWIALILAERNDLFRKWDIWIGTGLTLIIAAPWVFFVHQARRPTLAAMLPAAAAFPANAFHCLGPALSALVLLGAVLAPYRKEPRWAMVTGVLLGSWLFSCLAVVPWDNRYLTCAVPACMVLAALGLLFLAKAMNGVIAGSKRWAIVALAMLLAATSILHAWPLEHKRNLGYEPVVAGILSGPVGGKQVYLIAGDGDNEGDFIASVALRDPAATHIVLRSTKALAATDWNMHYYVNLFQSSTEMAAFLKNSWISLVVIQQDCLRPDVQMLRSAMDELKWVAVPAASGLLEYRRVTPLPPGPIRITVDMRESLGKELEATP